MGIAVDYMLTARCNLECPFCYGPAQDMRGELDVHQKRRLIGELATNGISHIIFGGGEPLISPHSPEVFSFAHALGLRIGLQTNGFILNRLREVLPHLDWLALPIDGVSPAVQLSMRTSAVQLDKTRAAVKLLRTEGSSHTQLKIGTVVSQSNINELVQIADEVALLKPDIWKWYQVRPRGAAKENFETLRLDSRLIDEAHQLVRTKYPHIPVFVSYIEQSIKAYVIINPDSEVLIPRVNDYVSAGLLLVPPDLTEFDKSAWARVLSELDMSAQRSNMSGTFPNWIENQT